MFGDVAVAVNPNDVRYYKDLSGPKCYLAAVNKLIRWQPDEHATLVSLVQGS